MVEKTENGPLDPLVQSLQRPVLVIVLCDWFPCFLLLRLPGLFFVP